MINSNIVLILTVILNLIMVLKFSKIKFFYTNIDKPDKIRKFHSKPTPLAGGQIIFLNILLYGILLNLFDNLLKEDIFFKDLIAFNSFLIICFSIFLLGFLDDKFNFKANTKFLILILIILLSLFLENDLLLKNIEFSFINENFILGKTKFFFTIFCILVFINAFNMFDGINLQSSFYSLFIFFCILSFFSNSVLIKILIISLVGFSYLNYRNKTFLGDSGSLLLAFIISYFFIKLYNLNYVKFADEIVLYMLIPGLDLIRLFIFRIIKKKSPLRSDRNHLHHLLLNKFSLNKTLVLILLLISFPIFLNYLNVNNLYTILITIFIYTALISCLYRKDSTFL